MQNYKTFQNRELYSNNSEKYFYKALSWATTNYKYVFCFNGGDYASGFDSTIFASDSLLPYTSIDMLKDFEPNEYKAIFMGYDLKNQIEATLTSKNNNHFDFPDLAIIEAQFKLSKRKNHFKFEIDKGNIDKYVNKINAHKQVYKKFVTPIFKAQTSKNKYINTVNNIKANIIEGDVYEMCYCMEYIDSNYKLESPDQLFRKLCQDTPTPFSSFVKFKDQFIISASPELFFEINGNKIISKPIKGTITRGKTEGEDLSLIKELRLSEKDKSENLMIVDLVRNDLSKISQAGSVKVEELFGIYSYPTVHQMISTISSKIEPDTSFQSIIAALFPMGSMTGAPKIKAMELIDEYEDFKRGLYSGSIGYFTATGFTSNVVIRTLQYNKNSNILGYHVGSAITFESNAENEFEECQLKSKILTTLF